MEQTVPAQFDTTYYKHAFEWNGLHVLAPEAVQEFSVLTVAETIFNMLRYRPDLVELLAEGGSRFSILPAGGVVTDAPEFRDLDGKDGFDGRPFNTLTGITGYSQEYPGWAAANIEANVLALPSDPFRGLENISLHEWAHVIHMGAIEKIPELNAELQAAWDHATAAGLWEGTYAGASIYEYFAVASAAFFNFERGPDESFNDVNTRAELEAYDPQLFAFLVKIYGNDTWRDGDWSGGKDADTLTGLATSDLMFGNGGDDLIVAENGNDSVYGGSGQDQIFAGATDQGNDRFFGEAGSDTLGGGAGDDLVVGGSESDVIFGGVGADSLYGGDIRPYAGLPEPPSVDLAGVSDTIWAGLGADLIVGDDSSDIVGGGAGNDTIEAGYGDDALFGGKDNAADPSNEDNLLGSGGDDTIYGGSDDDVLSGDDGDDLIFGGAGDDWLNCGAGNDVAWGGEGNDNIDGGSGADTFGFANGSGLDQVFDFEDGVDRIDLSAYAGIDDFSDIANSIVDVQGGVEIRLATADIILLAGVTGASLSAADFLFATDVA